MSEQIRVLADVDTALGIEAGDIDDAYALALLAAFPERVYLAGITVVGGNVTLPSASRSTRLVCELLEISCPIAEGASAPIDGRALVTGHSCVLKASGADEIWIYKREPSLTPATDAAVELLYQHAQAGPFDLLAVAPLTNVAHFIQQHPREAQTIQRIVTMGGYFAGEGGAEFNTQTDPVAAQAVYRSGIPTVVIPLEMTTRTRLHRADLARWESTGQAGATFVTGTHNWMDKMKQCYSMEGSHLHDPLAAAYLLKPELFQLEGIVPEIDTQTGLTRIGAKDPDSPVQLVTNFDEPGFYAFFKEAMDKLFAACTMV